MLNLYLEIHHTLDRPYVGTYNIVDNFFGFTNFTGFQKDKN